MSSSVQLPPLRPLDDFLLQSAQFQIPDLKDPDRWTNRVVSNLVYYQSNYFLSALVILILVGVFHPVQMVLGCLVVAGAFGGFVYASDHQAELRRFKRNHSGLAFAIILVVGYAIIYLIGSVLVFAFGIALPLLVILIHASLRKRNLRNKVTNKVEYIGLRRTPMGLLLESLGMEQEAGS